MGFGIEKRADELDVERMMSDERVARAVTAALVELARAEQMHPVWPVDVLHQIAILQEKVGTAQMAANDVAFRGKYPDRANHQQSLRCELVQVGAMAIRCLINLEHD